MLNPSSDDEEGTTEPSGPLNLGEDGSLSQCSITIQHPTRISHAASGFLLSSTKKCFAFARDKVVEYAELLPIKKQLQTLHIVKVFGCICKMTTLLYLEDTLEKDVRIRRDLVVLTTDAGQLIILKYQKLLEFERLQKRKSEQKLFEKIVYPFCEPGYHAEFPGHFLTTDPGGRAILIGAVLDKMILFMKTKSEGDPLKHLSIFIIDYAGYIIYDMVGLKPKNKLFEFAILRSKYMEKENAVREIDIFSCSDTKKFEHRREELRNKAELLAPVDPIGILAVSKHSIVYKSLDSRKMHLKKEIKVLNDKDYFLLVTPFKKLSHLAQSFKGKVCFIRVSIAAKEVTVLFVDVLPVARSWCTLTLKKSYLFISSEISDHFLYCINYASLKQSVLRKTVNKNQSEEKQIFEPVLMLPNCSPLFDFQIGDLANRGFSQMYIVGGRSNHSQLKVLELGCKIERDEELYWRIGEEFNNRTAWICKWETKENFLTENEVLLFVPESERTSVFILNCSKELKGDSSTEISPLQKRIKLFPFYTDESTLCCVQLGKNILQIIPSRIQLISK